MFYSLSVCGTFTDRCIRSAGYWFSDYRLPTSYQNTKPDIRDNYIPITWKQN